MKILVAASADYDWAGDPSHNIFSFPWPKDAEFRVLSVAEIVYPVAVGMVPEVLDTGEVQVRTDEQARDTANHTATRFRSLDLKADAVSLKGAPAASIVEHAKEWCADLIVVGSHDRSRMERLLMGSVAESVLKHAPCSLLVLKHPG